MTDPTPQPSGLLSRLPSAKPRVGVEQWLYRSIRDEVAELLTGSPFDVDSYLQNAYREIEKSEQLRAAAEQSGRTVLGGIMLGATLQLPIGGPLGQFYLTPRGEGKDENRRTVCVPMIGYRGFFELGYRSGRIRSFDYIVRREGDAWENGGNSERGKFFDWHQFKDGEFDENDENGERRALTGVVALASTLDSDKPAFQFMSKAMIERRRPKTTRNTPWEGPHREAMYVKTPHRELAKFLQLSIASAKAVEADEQISMWNRETETLDTIRDGEGVPLEVEGEIVGEVETPAEADEAAPAAAEPVPVAAEGREQITVPAAGRTAPPADSSNVDALDLPKHARELGRDMTPLEYERYSAAGGQ